MKRILAALLLPLAACGRPTPEDAFRRAQDSSARQDWKAMYEAFDPQETHMLLFSMMMVASSSIGGNSDAQKEFEAIGEKHGVRKDAIALDGADRDAAKRAIADRFSAVKDRIALFTDTMNFIQKYGKDASVKMTEGTLRDVREDGDRAKGTLERAGGKTETVHFVRRDGRWYIATGP